MKENLGKLILVVLVGVLVGVGIVSKQTSVPLLKHVLTKQAVTLRGLMKIEQKIDLLAAKKAVPAVVRNDSAQIKKLESRVVMLETQMKKILKIIPPNVLNGKAPQAGQRQAPDMTKVHNIPVAHSPIIGAPNAPITIVSFVDFECPFCAKFHTPIDDVMKAYPGKVKYIIKNFPLSFHKNARAASKATFAANEQGKYSEMVNAILDNGRQLSDAKYKELAKEIGLDVKKFEKDLVEKDTTWDKYIQDDMTLARNVGVRGTPTLFLNGKLTMARDINSFKIEIDQILKTRK